MTRITDSGRRIEDLVEGSGEERSPRVGALRCTTPAWLENGTQFDSCKERGELFELKLDAEQVIRSRDEGAAGMQPGGRRRPTPHRISPTAIAGPGESSRPGPR